MTPSSMPSQARSYDARPAARTSRTRAKASPLWTPSLLSVPQPWCLFLLLLSVGLDSSFAQPYEQDWSTLEAGGGTCSGGDYCLVGTIGQAEAAVSTAASYRIEGGFWPGWTTTSQAEPPRLQLQFVEGQGWISWSPDTPGFRLEQTTDLLAPNWVSGPTGNPTIIPLGDKAQFYRLRRP